MIIYLWIVHLLTLGVSASVTSNTKPDVLRKVRGDSVTLNTGVNQYHRVIWMFGPELRIVAQCHGKTSASPSCEIRDERFRDGLQIDRETGSLTFINLRDEHTGDYTLQIFNNNYRLQKRKITLIISAPLPSPVVVRAAESSCGRCVLLCSVLNVSDASLSWLRGSDLISSVRVSGLNSSVRLQISDGDSRSYSCVLNNTASEQTTHISISRDQLCPPCSGVDVGAVIGVMVVLVLLLAVIGSVMCIWRRSGRTRRRGGEEEEDEGEVIVVDTNNSDQPQFPGLMKNNDHSGPVITELHPLSSGVSNSVSAPSC